MKILFVSTANICRSFAVKLRSEYEIGNKILLVCRLRDSKIDGLFAKPPAFTDELFY